MATSMGFFSKLRSATSSRDQLLEELAILTGKNQGLVESMRRHAERCPYANVKAGVNAVAESEAAHIKTLEGILSDHNVWSKTPDAPLHDGENNWARLNGDLAIMGSLAAELRLAAVKWEPIDQMIGEQLLAISVEDEASEIELRKLASKCDPQALD
jgi:hypothetical protein